MLLVPTGRLLIYAKQPRVPAEELWHHVVEWCGDGGRRVVMWEEREGRNIYEGLLASGVLGAGQYQIHNVVTWIRRDRVKTLARHRYGTGSPPASRQSLRS